MMVLDGLLLGSPARNRELDSLILMGLFQHEIFYDSRHVSKKFLCSIFISDSNTDMLETQGNS